MNNQFIPFVEKYRPNDFENIVLEPLNKKILTNIIETSYFPHLLFYGPPGTGKTTTIINLINAYQEKINNKNKDLIIHLNASDERGIDIIRNQISYFVNSKPLFRTGMKFVILDEVDYMTKNAQQALRYLLQHYSSNVRFCLICNYISKIDDGLQNEFIRLRFNQLPEIDIINFLTHISNCENLNLTPTALSSIQKLFRSDIRSMINFMQSNQNIATADNKVSINIINDDIWVNLIEKIKNNSDINIVYDFISNISIQYNIDKKNIIKEFLNYIIRKEPSIVTSKYLNFVENLIHSKNTNSKLHILYSLSRLHTFICGDAIHCV